MINIVTIDFDVIMHRSLALYNDMVDDDADSILDVLNLCPDSNFIPNADLYLYKYLTDFILRCPKDKIKFIDNHHEIVRILDEMQINESFNIYNVDYHHDIAYADDDVQGNVEEVNCGNWVKYLFQKYKRLFKEYIWIKTKESRGYGDTKYLYRKYKDYAIDLFDFPGLSRKTDLLVICKSLPWVPDEQLELYKIWEQLIAQK